VLVIKIDDLDAQALEARLARGDDEFRPAVGELAATAADIAEFGRQHHAAAPPFDRLADQLFIVARAVGVGGIEERDAAIERLVNKRNAFIVAARAVDAGKRHAAESDYRHGDAGGAEHARRKFFNFAHVLSSH
jgi:hypothetical protein